MAKRIEILGNSIRCTDTVSGEIIFSKPTYDTWYSEPRLLNGQIMLYYCQRPRIDIGVYPLIFLADAVDSTNTPFTVETFRQFCFDNLAKQYEGAGFDADYQAVLDYATTQGYSLPSEGQQILQDALVVSLKSSGVWAKLDSFGVMATDGDANFALIDWKRLITMTAFNSPTFTTNVGYDTDGISSIIDTNYNPTANGVNLSLNSASYGYWINTPIGNTGADVTAGVRNSNTSEAILDIQRNVIQINNGIFFTTTNDNIGFRHYNRSSSTNVQRYVNGIVTNASVSSVGIPNFNFVLGALNNAGSIIAYRASQFSIYFMGGDLSTESTDFYNAINTYITSL